MHRVRAFDGLGRGFREPEIAHLALLDELGHRAHGVLDRGIGIHAMLIVEIDDLDAETAQARLAALPDVLGLAVDAAIAPVLATDVAELGGEDHLVAPATDGTCDQLLVASHPVHVGSIEKGDAELQRPLDCRNRLVFVAATVEIRHAHAAQAHRRHFEAGAKYSLFHALPFKRNAAGEAACYLRHVEARTVQTATRVTTCMPAGSCRLI